MRLLLICAFSLLCTLSVFGQDTVYYKYERIRMPSLEKSDYYSVFFQEDNQMQKEIQYTPSGVQKSVSYYKIVGKEKSKGGEWKTWYPNGQLKSVEHFKNDKYDGALTTYWDNGQLKRQDLYQKDSLISGKCYDLQGKEIAYFPYLIQPQFPGGEEAMFKYLKRKIHYPQSRDQIHGAVNARFLVTEKGEIIHVVILNKGLMPMQREVIRVLKKMPKWEPGKVDGVPMSAYYYLPVTFSLVPLE